MWYEDLTERNFFGKGFPMLITVGWLQNGKPYTKGETPQIVVEKINEIGQKSEVYQLWFGYHECDFCDFVNISLGAKTIMIAYKNKIYFVPGLITHYIEKHQYLPPDEFIEAVLNYDHQSAVDY